MSEVAMFGNCVEKTLEAQIQLVGPTFLEVTGSEFFNLI